MNDKEIEPLVLELSTEDYTGLWELLWAVQGKNKGLSETELRSRVVLAVRSLVNKGLLGLYRAVRFDGDEREIVVGDVETVLRQESSWAEPTTAGEHIRVAATAKGREQYFRGSDHG